MIQSLIKDNVNMSDLVNIRILVIIWYIIILNVLLQMSLPTKYTSIYRVSQKKGYKFDLIYRWKYFLNQS